MSFAITAGAAFTAGSAIYLGAQQKKRAKAIQEGAVDPGIQRNYALDRVTNTLYQNYSNWNLPGYNNYVQQIQSNMATANRNASLGATSSADLLNSVTNTQVAGDNALGNLALQNASGREQALMNYLNAVQNQGNDQVRVNTLALDRYNATLAEAAALEGAGNQNINQGFQDAVIGTSAIASNFMPRQTVDQRTGNVINLPSVWDSYRNRRRSGSASQQPLRNFDYNASLEVGGLYA